MYKNTCLDKAKIIATETYLHPPHLKHCKRPSPPKNMLRPALRFPAQVIIDFCLSKLLMIDLLPILELVENNESLS